MNQGLKRIAAMMMALMLMLTGLSALAQAPAATEAEVFARGGRIKTETNIDVNPETLNGILAMFTGMSSQEGQDAQTAIINTVLGALRKLTASVVTDGKAAYLSVGSETGELFNQLAGKIGAMTGDRAQPAREPDPLFHPPAGGRAEPAWRVERIRRGRDDVCQRRAAREILP